MNEVMFVTGGELLQFLPISSKKRVGMLVMAVLYSMWNGWGSPKNYCL